jgi:hypothetical protein
MRIISSEKIPIKLWLDDIEEGAIVIDIDCDNRIMPGQIMKMKFPKYLNENQMGDKNEC